MDRKRGGEGRIGGWVRKRPPSQILHVKLKGSNRIVLDVGSNGGRSNAYGITRGSEEGVSA